MSGLLGGKPKAVTAPPVPSPPAIPEVDVGVGERAKRKRPVGSREFFLTGDLVPSEEFLKKSRLG